jgi:hypothetical protein
MCNWALRFRKGFRPLFLIAAPEQLEAFDGITSPRADGHTLFPDNLISVTMW